MAEFRPIYPAHAIERCSVSFIFDTEVPLKSFKIIIEKAEADVKSKGFIIGSRPAGFNIDPATGKVTPITDGGPSIFASSDSQVQIMLAPNSVTLTTSQYIRWAAFKNLIYSALRLMLEEFDRVVNLSAVKLEYWDRFNWTGDWGDFDASKLLDFSSGHVVSHLKDVQREGHSHVGWFEYEQYQRRLVNVNIDIQGLMQLGFASQPSVGIYTMIQDQSLNPNTQLEFESTDPMVRLDSIHIELKKIMASIILENIAKDIGLWGG